MDMLSRSALCSFARKGAGVAFAVLAVSTATGCPSPPPAKQPVTLPAARPPVVADECTSFGASIDSGASGVPFASHKPTSGKILSATCADENICFTDVQESTVVVHGKSPGSTTVDVEYQHPQTGERGKGKVKVTFTPVPIPDPLHPRMAGGPNACVK